MKRFRWNPFSSSVNKSIDTKEDRDPLHSFHGGCHECTMQRKKGLGYCVGCCYFEGDWDLPSLNDYEIKEEERKNLMRNRARKLARKTSKP